MAIKPSIKPINKTIYVEKSGVREIDSKDVSIDIVGQKAFGLSCVFKPWTLPYFVISAELFNEYKLNGDFDEAWLSAFDIARLQCGISSESIIARSSAISESILDRGKLESKRGRWRDLHKALLECFRNFDSQDDDGALLVPIVVQQYAEPFLGKGHMSNERRVSRESRDWHVEYDQFDLKYFPDNAKLPTQDEVNISLRAWRNKIEIDSFSGKPLSCIDNQAERILPVVATWGYSFNERMHFEWVHDGTTVYVVQVDFENEILGVDPYDVSKKTRVNYAAKNLECLKLIDNDAIEELGSFNKARCYITFRRLSLPTAPLYYLKDKQVINTIAAGMIPPALERDLKKLSDASLIIRMDVNSEDKAFRQMLGKTEEIRSYSLAVDWLQKECAKIVIDQDHDYLLLFHNFIPALSAAFAYASPLDRIVVIESLWGMPDGLYYYAHDKYVIDTKALKVEKLNESEFSIQNISQNKKYFIAPNELGEWKIEIVSPPYDWSNSIPKDDWIREISSRTRRISRFTNESISVMWFVGVDEKAFFTSVIPWHFEEYDYSTVPAQAAKRRYNTDSVAVISTIGDLEKYEALLDTGTKISRIEILPVEINLVRDKELISRIGDLAKKLDAVIVLEGGVLSHAYYQLVRTAAKVEVKSTFQISGMSRSFGKLVRDKIPEKISAGGEMTITKLFPDELMYYLRRKLIEEAYEVYDARNKQEIIEELADVQEICDSIRKCKGISKKDVIDIQKKKKEKSGGFEQGKILEKTDMDSVIAHQFAAESTSKPQNAIQKWVDRREYPDGRESITKARVPISLNNWTLQASHRTNDNKHSIATIVSGRRDKSELVIEIMNYEKPEQLKLDTNDSE